MCMHSIQIHSDKVFRTSKKQIQKNKNKNKIERINWLDIQTDAHTFTQCYTH